MPLKPIPIITFVLLSSSYQLTFFYVPLEKVHRNSRIPGIPTNSYEYLKDCGVRTMRNIFQIVRFNGN